MVEVSPAAPLLALSLVERYSLKPRDAFHASVMKENNIEVTAGDDEDFDRIEWVKRVKLQERLSCVDKGCLGRASVRSRLRVGRNLATVT